MAEVKNLVQRWRDIKEEIRGAEEQREKARKLLSEQDQEYCQSVEKADQQRAQFKHALADIESAVAEERATLEKTTKEVDEMMNKAIQDRDKNQEYRKKLTLHMQQLEEADNRIRGNDASMLKELNDFRMERERRRNQLIQIKQALEQTIPKERQETANKIDEAKQRKELARKTLDAEKKRWAMKVASRKRDRHDEMLIAVQDEFEAAREGRQIARKLKTDAEKSVRKDKDLLSQIRQVRTTLNDQLTKNGSSTHNNSDEQQQNQQQQQMQSFILGGGDSAIVCS